MKCAKGVLCSVSGQALSSTTLASRVAKEDKVIPQDVTRQCALCALIKAFVCVGISDTTHIQEANSNARKAALCRLACISTYPNCLRVCAELKACTAQVQGVSPKLAWQMVQANTVSAAVFSTGQAQHSLPVIMKRLQATSIKRSRGTFNKMSMINKMKALRAAKRMDSKKRPDVARSDGSASPDTAAFAGDGEQLAMSDLHLACIMIPLMPPL